MPTPVSRHQFIADERINRRCVRHTQQRFGQAHQRDSFVGGQTIFNQEGRHHTWGLTLPDELDQCGGFRLNSIALPGVQRGFFKQRVDNLGFGSELMFPHIATMRRNRIR